MSHYKHIIFDLDGTLLDTIPDLVFNLNRTFSELGLPGDFSEKEMETFLGSGKDEQIRRALRARSLSEDHFNAVNNVLSKYYASNAATLTKVYEGVLETLKNLEERGTKLYIATNKPEHVAKDIVPLYFPDNHFIMVRGDRGDGIVKPNPKFLQSVKEIIHSPITDILFVGDSHIDFLSAKNIGMKCAIVPHGYDSFVLTLKEDSLITLKSFSDLLNM